MATKVDIVELRHDLNHKIEDVKKNLSAEISEVVRTCLQAIINVKKHGKSP